MSSGPGPAKVYRFRRSCRPFSEQVRLLVRNMLIFFQPGLVSWPQADLPGSRAGFNNGPTTSGSCHDFRESSAIAGERREGNRRPRHLRVVLDLVGTTLLRTRVQRRPRCQQGFQLRGRTELPGRLKHWCGRIGQPALSRRHPPGNNPTRATARGSTVPQVSQNRKAPLTTPYA
jgi:hypothetical protein